MRITQTGLLEWDRSRSEAGLTLFSTIHGDSARLLDMSGQVVHEWRLGAPCAGLVRLLPGGHLLSTEVSDKGREARGGKGGLIREYDWDGALVWEHVDHGQHHDAVRLENGNTIYLGWEVMPEEAARRVVGGLPGTEGDDGPIYSDYLREVAPSGESVWEWHAHNMNLAAHPLAPLSRRNEYAHANSCFPADGGVLVSFRRLNAIATIDRATQQVRWHQHDRTWGGQHDAQVLENGNILLFANGCNVPDMPFSRVLEIDPQTGATVWEYRGQPVLTFFSPHISGAQRLPSGNTLICEGAFGRLFEVTREKEIVWEYISPFEADGHLGQHNWVFRAYRYRAASPEIGNRLKPHGGSISSSVLP